MKNQGDKTDFMTIRTYLKERPTCDILFIDECSMVSNDDMEKILSSPLFRYIVLSGDISQIQAIDYGTWFKLAKCILPKSCKFELTILHRTSMPELITLWEYVRKKDKVIDELLCNEYVKEINDEKAV